MLPSWRMVYLHDPSGKAVEASKSALFDAVRRGSVPVRLGVAIGSPDNPASVEYAAEPVFISLMNKADVTLTSDE